MTPEVESAIEEIGATFADASVTVNDDGSGGTFVEIDPVDPGEIYVQRTTWIGFQITFQYPYADVYPHFVRGDLERADGQPLGEGISPTTWRDLPALQISRRSSRLNPITNTAAVKALKVLQWLRTR